MGDRTVSGSQVTPGTNLVVAEGARRSWARLKRSFNKRPEFRLVRSNAPLADAVGECQALRPCVLLTDFASLARLDRPGDFAQKLGFGRIIPVLVLIDGQPQEALEPLLRLGLMGFLPADAQPGQIRRAVQAIAGGEVWAPRRLLTRVFQDFLAEQDRDGLTTRETEILAFVTQGYSNKDAAQALHLSRETVRWHMRSIYSKIGLHDRQSAALYGLRHGLDKRTLSPSVTGSSVPGSAAPGN
jgi:DNA-binding NarL/FixJ family response regulator